MIAILVLLLVILIIASLFSFLETATVAVSEHRIGALKQKHLWAKYAYCLKKQINQILIFSLFGNSLFNAIFTILTTIITSKIFIHGHHEATLLLTTLLVALLIIIFSEALPKIIAANNPIQVLRVISIPLYYIFRASMPIIWLIDKLVLIITKSLMIKHGEGASLDEVKAIIADKRSPFRSDLHRSILLKSIEIEKIYVKEVLIPIRSVAAIDIQWDLVDIYRHIYTTHHTRIVIYDGTSDNMIGYIHVKDILGLEQYKFTKNDLKLVMCQLPIIYDFMPIMRQIGLSEQQKQRLFMVVNEYDDTLGIACLEDMLELIFGNFTTEAPHQKSLAIKRSENELIVDGTMLIRDLNQTYSLNIASSSDGLTVNGLVLKTLNGIPNLGVCFRIEKFIFQVLSMGDYWVERVKITLL